jgi:short-subunit dehydrogenase
VTGAGRGLGQQLVIGLRSQGYHVVGADLAGADATLDVRDPQACRDLAREVAPHVWINNAGVLGAGDAATQPDDLVESVVAVNLIGVMNGTRAAVEQMRLRSDGRGEGHIVNVGSLASWVPVPGECVYAATKAGVLSFTLGLRAELRAQGVTGVRLSVVCPDGMLTPMIADVISDPAVALTFTGLRLTTPERVTRRVLRLIEHPRSIASVPRWRGAQVRLLGAIPDATLHLAPLFAAIGRRNQRRAQPNRPEM